ncbi:MAG: oxidoreductase [Lentisphaerae bacterium RIFOXYC12_FULL_60_16]|nr:MAG: oxidoreductase [Lentisphaerae bacterium RIFOXYC12_FULL_60_16]OGV84196.1 MAG: oxidoreductase [Lentisphaerae bacterium RIFOXYB12_FULL_60_10]
MNRLKGKTAIVTGGTSGMGRGIAELFAAEGAAVVIGGRDVDRGREVVDGITAAGGVATCVSGDIATVEANQALVDAAVKRFGGVDILVPNAGVLGIGGVKDSSIETWQQTIDINLNAVYYLIKLAVPHLLERGGSIVVNGSIAAFKAFPNHPAYCASKGALVSLVRQLAIDLAPTIRVNILCPGQVDTPLLWDSAKAFPDPKTAVQDAIDRIPLKRLGTPEDIAKAVLFLASDESSWITGTALTIDGGLMTGG